MAAAKSLAPLTGLVLAGGASARMGSDKALLRVAGRPLVLLVAERLAEVCDQVLVASGDGRRLEELGVAQVADAASRAGPLAGLVAGLEAAATPLVAVVAVDMPFASTAVLTLLAERWAGEAAVVPHADGRLQPLHAVWSSAAAPAVRQRLASGQHGVTAAAEALGAAVVPAEQWRRADPSGRFARNLNRPEDLRFVIPDGGVPRQG